MMPRVGENYIQLVGPPMLRVFLEWYLPTFAQRRMGGRTVHIKPRGSR